MDPTQEHGKGRLRGNFGYFGEIGLICLAAVTTGMVVAGY